MHFWRTFRCWIVIWLQVFFKCKTHWYSSTISAFKIKVIVIENQPFLISWLLTLYSFLPSHISLRMWGAANLSLTLVWSEQRRRPPWNLSSFQPSLRSVWSQENGCVGLLENRGSLVQFQGGSKWMWTGSHHWCGCCCQWLQWEMLWMGILLLN